MPHVKALRDPKWKHTENSTSSMLSIKPWFSPLRGTLFLLLAAAVRMYLRNSRRYFIFSVFFQIIYKWSVWINLHFASLISFQTRRTAEIWRAREPRVRDCSHTVGSSTRHARFGQQDGPTGVITVIPTNIIINGNCQRKNLILEFPNDILDICFMAHSQFFLMDILCELVPEVCCLLPNDCWDRLQQTPIPMSPGKSGYRKRIIEITSHLSRS